MGKENAVQEKQEKIDDYTFHDTMDSYGRNLEEQDHFLARLKWEKRLLEIHGKSVTLRHKHIENNDTTINFAFSPESIELQNGVTIEPNQAIGQVGAYNSMPAQEEGTADSRSGIVFFTPGGRLKFNPPNLKSTEEQTAELAMVHIIAPPTTENGRVPAEVSASLQDSITIEPLSGFRIELKLGQYQKSAMSPDGSLKFLDAVISYQDTVLADAVELESDDLGLRFSGGQSVTFDASPLMDTLGVNAGISITGEMSLSESGPSLHLRKKSQPEAAEEKQPEAPQERALQPVAPQEEEIIKEITPEEAEKESSDSFEEASLLIGGLRFILRQGIRRGTKLRYKILNAKTGSVLFHGLALHLKDITVDDRQEDLKAKNITLEEKIPTLDNFAELESATVDYEKHGDAPAQVTGKGNFKLMDIPYRLEIADGEQIKGVAKAPEDSVEDIEVSIADSGKMNAAFEDNDQTFNLNELEGKENSSESFIQTAMLSGITVTDSYLQANALRIDRGLKIEQEAGEEDEKTALQRLFSCSVMGTLANTATETSLTKEGLYAKEGKNTLGILKVEEFLGFLSGSIDYPAGKISVSASKEAEAPDTPAFLNIKQQNLGGEGLLIPIFSPFLHARLGVKPIASIGGSVSADVDRGKSFGQKWTDEDALTTTLGIGLEGKAGAEAFAGLEAGIPLLLSADAVLHGELAANLKADLEAKTAVGLAQGEKKKLEQKENFTFSGKLEGDLTATASFTSDLHLLFWKAQLFQIELAKAELGSLKFEGSGYKSKEEKGLTKGWNIEKMQFDTEGLAKKASDGVKNALKKKKTKDVPLSEKIRENTEQAGQEAQNAWAALLQLQENEADITYAVTGEEKTALQLQIKNMRESVERTITNYMNRLKEEQTALNAKIQILEAQIQSAQKQIDKSRENLGLRNQFTKRVHETGFDEMAKKYQFDEVSEKMSDNERDKVQKSNLNKLKTAAVDLAIAKVLTGAPDIGTLRNQYIEKEKQAWVTDDQNNPEAFQKQENFLYNETKYHGKETEDMAYAYGDYYKKYATYHFILNTPVLENRKKSSIPKPYRRIVEANASILGRELLDCALHDKDLDGKPIEATAEDKRNLLLFCSEIPKKMNNKTGGVLSGMSDFRKNAEKALFEEIDKYYKPMYGEDLDKMVKGGKVDYFGQIFRADALLKEAKKTKEDKEADLHEKTVLLEAASEQLKECSSRLKELHDSAEGAIREKNFSPEKAKKAVSIYTEEYLDKMNNDKALNTEIDNKARTLMKPANRK